MKSRPPSVPFCRKDTNEIVYFTPAPWAIQQIKRETGLVEDVCAHGVGHPNAGCLVYIAELRLGEHWAVHGCDGCCQDTHKGAE